MPHNDRKEWTLATSYEQINPPKDKHTWAVELLASATHQFWSIPSCNIPCNRSPTFAKDGRFVGSSAQQDYTLGFEQNSTMADGRRQREGTRYDQDCTATGALCTTVQELNKQVRGGGGGGQHCTRHST